MYSPDDSEDDEGYVVNPFSTIFEKDSTIPTYDVGDMDGHTGYIDYLIWDEITYPIMKGIDKYQRPFIVIKLYLNGTRIMQTFFQRYTDSYNDWRGCGHATKMLMNNTGPMRKKHVNLVNKIISTLTHTEQYISIEIKKKHNPESEIFIGKYLAICDYNKGYIALHNMQDIIASRTIQRAWRLCRYNPYYYMCRKIQERKYDMVLC